MPPTKESPWILRMPIYVREENLENVIIYLYERLSEYARYAVFEWVENLKIFGAEPRIFFTYCQSDQNVTTDNQLVPVETEVPPPIHLSAAFYKSPTGSWSIHSDNR